MWKWVVLLLIIIVIVHLLARPLSPRGEQGAIYAVWVNDEYEKLLEVRGSDLDCQIAGDSVTKCHLDLDEKLLAISMTQRAGSRLLGATCSATFAGQAVACDTAWDYGQAGAAAVVQQDEVGISAETIATYQQSAPYLYWSENSWIQLALIIAGIVGILSIALRWFTFRPDAIPDQSPRVHASLSLLVGLVTWFVLAWGAGVITRAIVGYDPTYQVWSLMRVLYLLCGIVAGGWHWWVYHPDNESLPVASTTVRGFSSLASGMLIFVFTHWLLMLNLLFLGWID